MDNKKSHKMITAIGYLIRTIGQENPLLNLLIFFMYSIYGRGIVFTGLYSFTGGARR